MPSTPDRLTSVTDLRTNATDTTLEDECLHGMEPSWCSLCRKAAGYQPGKDRFNNDCAVLSFVEVTGATYEEAVEALLATGDYRPGHGINIDALLRALADNGFAATPTSAVTRGMVLVAAWDRRGGHAYTINNDKPCRAGRWIRATKQRAWSVA